MEILNRKRLLGQSWPGGLPGEHLERMASQELEPGPVREARPASGQPGGQGGDQRHVDQPQPAHIDPSHSMVGPTQLGHTNSMAQGKAEGKAGHNEQDPGPAPGNTS